MLKKASRFVSHSAEETPRVAHGTSKRVWSLAVGLASIGSQREELTIYHPSLPF
jgi:hypothetical protein